METSDKRPDEVEFQQKLDASKKSIQEDESLRGIAFAAEAVLSKLKSSSEITFYKNVRSGIFIISSLIFIIHIMSRTYWAGIAGVVAVLLLLIFSKINITRKVKQMQLSKVKRISQGLLNQAEVLDFLKYIKDVIAVKFERIQMLRTIISILLPLVFLAGTELILSRSGVLEIIVAIIFGVAFWYFYFRQNMTQLEEITTEIDKYFLLL